MLVRRQTERFAGLPLVDDSPAPPRSPDATDDDDWPPGPGFISLAHHGCGTFDVLVVTGEQRGRVWFCDMQWFPRSSQHGVQGFLDWYEAWLDDNLVM